jgi:hypothetical protein
MAINSTGSSFSQPHSISAYYCVWSFSNSFFYIKDGVQYFANTNNEVKKI